MDKTAASATINTRCDFVNGAGQTISLKRKDLILTYEELLLKHDDLIIEELDLSEIPDLKGLYVDGMIAIHNRLSTTTEKACILAEELGHHYTSSGNILDQSHVENRKQERHARLWAYHCMMGLERLIEAAEHGCRTLYDTAEFLDVTEEFLAEAIAAYRSKYGIGVMFKNHWIQFIPNLRVYEYHFLLQSSR